MILKNHLATLLTAAAFMATGSTAFATVVSVDISGATYTGAGVLDTSSHTWLSKTSNGSTFSLDSQTVTLGLTNWFADGSADTAIDLFDHYKHNNGTLTSVFSLSGLNNALVYDIVIYSAQNAFGGRGGMFDLTTGSYAGLDPQTTTGDQQSSFTEGVNYVRYTGITAVGGVISFNASNSPDGIAVMNGFEVSAVPEPSTYGLIGAGAIALVTAVRRRRRVGA